MTSRQKPLTFSYAARAEPTRTTPTRPCHSPWSEALECVQLAAVFPPASLLAGTPPRELARGNAKRERILPAGKLAGERAAATCRTPKLRTRKQAVWDPGSR